MAKIDLNELFLDLRVNALIADNSKNLEIYLKLYKLYDDKNVDAISYLGICNSFAEEIGLQIKEKPELVQVAIDKMLDVQLLREWELDDQGMSYELIRRMEDLIDG